MTGFGRTGKMFACEHFDLVPDIMCIAKGMSAGYAPIGAVVANNDIFNTIMVNGKGSFKHGHTYGGHPLSCAVASKVIDIVSDGLVENSRVRGSELLEHIKSFDHPLIGDIRGLGLMIGIEFVSNKETKDPFDTSINLKSRITKHCLDEGLVVYPGSGTYHFTEGDHILIAPPLTISEEEIILIYKKLHLALDVTLEELKKENLWKN